MKQKAIQFSSILAGIAFLAVFFGAAIQNTPATNAISALDFKAGNIIDDGVFYNKNTMTVEEIQAHLNRYMPACDTWGTGAVGSGRYINGKAVPANTTRAEYARQMRAAGKTRYHEPPYVCVQNYYENPTTHETLYDTKNVIKEGMISAAQIIYNAAQEYGVNPQVLLVMLRKESYVWGDNWPLKDEYNTVMGYACPDNAPCNEKYFGFYNQVMTSAWQLNYYKEHIYSYNYRPYATNYILYSPTASCGRKEVYLENLATTSLYIYTPYTPNDAALRNYPGTATCGSYGNRNFFMYFSEWFGSTHGFTASKRIVPETNYRILSDDGAKVLHVENNSKDSEAKIITSDSNSDSSSFSFKQNSDSSYTITNINSGLVLSLPSSGAILDAKIQQASASNTTSQKWFIYSGNNGSYYIASAASPAYILSINTAGEVVLDIYGSQSGKPLLLKPIADTSLASGKYKISSALGTKLALNESSDSTSSNSNINVSTLGNNNSQIFNIVADAESGFYKLETNQKNNVAVESDSIKNSLNVSANSVKDSCSQKFAIIKDASGNYSINSACDLSYALDIAGGFANSGTNVIVYSYENNKKNQEWWFEKVNTETTTPTPATQQPVADGNYAIRSALRANYALDVRKGLTANGSNVNTWTNNGSKAQVYNLKYIKDKDAYLITYVNGNRVLDLAGGVAKNSANVQIYDANSSCGQYWKLIKKASGNYAIASSCNTKYVFDIAGSNINDGANVIVYESHDSKNQEWWFEKI